MALSLALVLLLYLTILSKVMLPNTIASAKIGDDAASAVEQRVLGWCRSHEGASVAEKREATKLIMGVIGKKVCPFSHPNPSSPLQF